MSVIGNTPSFGDFTVLDTIVVVGDSDQFTLSKNSQPQSKYIAEQLLVSVNGTIQAPGSSFTVSGSTITFSETLDSNDEINFILAIGQANNIATVSDGAITAAKLNSAIAVTETPVRINSNSIDTNFTVGANQNAMVAGPVDINAEIVVQGTFTVV
jgi:hypothetical protein